MYTVLHSHLVAEPTGSVTCYMTLDHFFNLTNLKRKVYICSKGMLEASVILCI